MKKFVLGKRSRRNLEGVHPELVGVVEEAIEITKVDFAVTEGLRNLERQEELVAKGASKTMRSRHLTGHAVDVAAFVDGKISYTWEYYEEIARAFKLAAARLGVKVEWGGDWQTFKDGPHFQLPWKEYPAK